MLIPQQGKLVWFAEVYVELWYLDLCFWFHPSFSERGDAYEAGGWEEDA